MEGASVALAALLSIMAAYVGHQVYQSYSGQNYRRRLMENIDPSENEAELKQHTEHFKQGVIKVTDHIYVAIGYALGNSIMVDAPEGLIIVDVTETVESGRQVFAEFRKISKKPVKAIVYTHQHPDHTWGAKAFIEDVNNPPEIWAHRTTPRAINLFLTTGAEARMVRGFRQFGSALSGKQVINDGIGPNIELKTTDDKSMGLVYPNKLLKEEQLETKIAGLDVVLHHIPGETDDQIGLYIPRDTAFLCGDDFYKAFPNIYTIRGATARDAVDWYTSLDKMIDSEPEHLVPSHTQPISGKQAIRDVLIPYRDGIQYVHDQTVRFMNKGLSPDDIAHQVQLPDNLRLNPYLREYYGTVFWSVKGIFNKYLGWFSGEPEELFSIPSDERATTMVELAGGIGNMVDAAQKALNDKQFQWALELSSYALKVESSNQQARNLKVEAMTSLAARQLSPIARNYYLTCALETSAEIDIRATPEVEANVIEFLPVEEHFVIFQMKFQPEVCGDRKTTAVFDFADVKRIISVQLRNGVAVVKHKSLEKPDLKIKTSSAVWKKLLMAHFKDLGEYTKDQLIIEGGITNFKQFLGCFQG